MFYHLYDNLHRFTHALHRLARHHSGALRSFEQNLAQLVGPGEHRGAALSNGRQVRVERVGELRLHLDVAHFAGAIARLEILDLAGVRVEHVVIRKHRIAFDGARNVGSNPLRIRVHLAHFLRHGLGVVSQLNRVAVALAHLPVVEARQQRHRRQERLRLDEHVPVELIEAAHRFARELEVDDLIFADRHEVRVVDRHVGRLKQRIAEEPDRREILFRELLLLILVGRHALEPGNRDHHREQQVQLRVLRHERLDENRAPLRIEAGGEPVRDVVERVRGHLAGVGVVARQRVPVGDEIEAVVLLLQRHPVAERADQVPQMQPSRRPHARNDARSRRR